MAPEFITGLQGGEILPRHIRFHLQGHKAIKGIYMSSVPTNLQYTKEHEWVSQEAATGVVRIGISDFAQSALGDIVYVQLPSIGDALIAGKVCGEVESTKSVSEIYSPVSGTVQAINENLISSPEDLNSDPYGKGWMVEISLSGMPADLLSAAEYAQLTA